MRPPSGIISLPARPVEAPARLLGSLADRSRVSASFAWLNALPKDVVVVAALALVALIGWFDYLTGDFSLSFFYLLPVALATWSAGRTGGWAVALLSAATWVGANHLDSASVRHPLVTYWDAAMIAAGNGLVVHLLAALHRFQTELEARVQRRTASLAQANAELEAAKLQLIEAAKLELLGRLSAGLAHEVKNPLHVITMGIDLIADEINAGRVTDADTLELVRGAAAQASRVLAEMLDFARPGAISIRVHDFCDLADRALGMLKPELNRKGLVIRRDWESPRAMIPMDRTKIEQVMLNVLLNAIQATPNQGTITVRTRLDQADGLTVEVDDAGPGIAAEHREKLFEPFFTTKPPGQGTGLGLSVSQQIVRLHGGTLGLANRPKGGGARATIRLPLRA